MASVQKFRGKGNNVGHTRINSTPCTSILHPILHPKSSVNTGHLVPWCRKCRRFSKTFFVKRGRGERVSGSERTKHRTSLNKSTDVLFQKYGYLHRRSPMFLFSGRTYEKLHIIPIEMQKLFAGLTHCQARHTRQLDFSYNASFSALNVAKVMMRENEQPYSMASFKSLMFNSYYTKRIFDVSRIRPNQTLISRA